MPNISKSLQEMQPLLTQIPTIDMMGLNQTLNTIVKCRVCRGQRIIANLSHVTLTYTFKKCPMCLGSGTMQNREGYYDSR